MTETIHGLPLATMLAAFLAALPPCALSAREADGTERARRRAALVAELLEEGADGEALAEAARLRKDVPDAAEVALSPLAPALAEATQRIAARDPLPAARTGAATEPAPPGGVGGWTARRVVGFYRLFIGPAIGQRCVLEPSCSRYFLLASRKHGLLGIPMTADRFVREPKASAPDRPWIRNEAGEWRHPDPVEDHDFWFSDRSRQP